MQFCEHAHLVRVVILTYSQLPRYTPDGSVYDRAPTFGAQLIIFYLSAFVPTFFNWLIDTVVRSISKKGFPDAKPSWDFDKAAPPAVKPPLIADALYPHLQSGFCEPVDAIDKITGPKSIQLKSGRILENIDTIIYCTGYHYTIPVTFEPAELNPYPYPGSPSNLYRNMFPLHSDPRIRNTLAFLGQGALPLAGFLQFEIAAFCISAIWSGKSSLPSLPEMKKWHAEHLAWRDEMERRYNPGSTFLTAFMRAGDAVAWMDECAGLGIREHFGLLGRWTSWRAWSLWWRDRELYNVCLGGMISPAIFRLLDCGKRRTWERAREQIFVDNERIEQQQRDKKKAMEKAKVA